MCWVWKEGTVCWKNSGSLFHWPKVDWIKLTSHVEAESLSQNLQRSWEGIYLSLIFLRAQSRSPGENGAHPSLFKVGSWAQSLLIKEVPVEEIDYASCINTVLWWLSAPTFCQCNFIRSSISLSLSFPLLSLSFSLSFNVSHKSRWDGWTILSCPLLRLKRTLSAISERKLGGSGVFADHLCPDCITRALLIILSRVGVPNVPKAVSSGY